MIKFQPVIGLEIHVELKTKSKMFCSCSADYFGHPPNSHVCPVCLGLPGALPVANKKAIENVILAGLALNCQVPLFSKFDRKNYFYPDLPKGYQISQYDLPFCQKGRLENIQIRRVHLEEDTAKMIHTTIKSKKFSLLDFNRSGMPLMEVVTEPDIKSPQQAKEFLKKLQQIIRFLNISDCDMEKGSMRLEANISLAKTPKAALPNYKVEIKNLNSFRFVEKALTYEIERQTKILEQGKKPIQETRGWHQGKNQTFSQRSKEKAEDYRYFPEPDLPPIRWIKKEIIQFKDQLPELPSAKRSRFEKKYQLKSSQAEILTSTQAKADYFEQAVKLGEKQKMKAKEIANLIINKKFDQEKILPAKLIKILTAKKSKVSLSSKQLPPIIKKVLKNNPKPVSDFKKGKENALEFLVGQVMREAKGQANPNQIRRLLRITL